MTARPRGLAKKTWNWCSPPTSLPVRFPPARSLENPRISHPKPGLITIHAKANVFIELDNRKRILLKSRAVHCYAFDREPDCRQVAIRAVI